MNPASKHSTLLASFCTFYNSFTNIFPDRYTQHEYIATYLPGETITKPLSSKCLLEILKEVIAIFQEVIVMLLKIAMTIFAGGIWHKKVKNVQLCSKCQQKLLHSSEDM